MKNLLVTSSIMTYIKIALLFTFDLMNNLLAASAIMRMKVSKFIMLHLWLIFSPYYKTPVHKKFQSHD